MFKLEVKKIVYIVRNEEQTVWTYTELKQLNVLGENNNASGNFNLHLDC